MNVVDSSAWLEFFAEGTLAAMFAPIIEDRRNLIVPTITVYEVHKRMFAQRGAEDALKAISMMQHGRVIVLDNQLAIDASILSSTRKLPMADSIIYATAQAYNATLWTADSDFKDLPNVRYFDKRKPQ